MHRTISTYQFKSSTSNATRRSLSGRLSCPGSRKSWTSRLPAKSSTRWCRHIAAKRSWNISKRITKIVLQWMGKSNWFSFFFVCIFIVCVYVPSIWPIQSFDDLSNQFPSSQLIKWSSNVSRSNCIVSTLLPLTISTSFKTQYNG